MRSDEAKTHTTWQAMAEQPPKDSKPTHGTLRGEPYVWFDNGGRGLLCCEAPHPNSIPVRACDVSEEQALAMGMGGIGKSGASNWHWHVSLTYGPDAWTSWGWLTEYTTTTGEGK